MAIELQIPAETRSKLEQILKPAQLRRAEFQVVKRTTAQLAKLVRAEVRQQITIASKNTKRAIIVAEPKGDPPVGKVIVSGKRIPMVAFKHQPWRTMKGVTSGGVSITVRKDWPPIVLRHAFIANVKQINAKSLETVGHVGIFLRSRHAPTKGFNAGLRDRFGHPKYKLTPEGFAGRLSIEQEFGPSIAKLLSIPAVLNRIEFDAAAYMMKVAQGQIDRFTKPPSASAAE
jgi:hypothetical protein